MFSSHDSHSFTGAHILSGNVFEPRSLDELIPDWRQEGVCYIFPILLMFPYIKDRDTCACKSISPVVFIFSLIVRYLSMCFLATDFYDLASLQGAKVAALYCYF